MTLSVTAAPSPNFDDRVRAPDMIVLHYTGMPSGAAALARLRDPVARVSAHWFVEEDGRTLRLGGRGGARLACRCLRMGRRARY